ncbi:MAG: helix-turn-helix transcriptional regulator [Bacteroidota bacterium]|nr:helix-turn-helix transcriptional regulator [Bacteroidota bacterium]
MESTNKKEINRIRVVLAEKNRANKWLAKQLSKTPTTVSKWCSNSAQPSLETLVEIAKVLDVDITALLNHTKES